MKTAPILVFALICAGCATRPRQYQPPDPAKVNAATHQVQKDAQKSRDLAGQEKALVKSAQEKADAAIVISNALDTQSEAILKEAPESLKPQVLELTRNIDALQNKEAELNGDLQDAWGRANELEQHLTVSDRHISELEAQQADYFKQAQGLADNATEERNKRIKAEQSLSWYRWHWWGSWIVLGAGVLVCIILAVIKWGAKWSAKVAVAAGKAGI